jgi:hypothetical protein
MCCPNLGFQSTNSSRTDVLIRSVVYLFGLASLNYPKSLSISGNTIQGKLHMNSPTLLFHISKYKYIASWRLFNLKRTLGIVARRKRFGLMATNSVHNIHSQYRQLLGLEQWVTICEAIVCSRSTSLCSCTPLTVGPFMGEGGNNHNACYYAASQSAPCTFPCNVATSSMALPSVSLSRSSPFRY